MLDKLKPVEPRFDVDDHGIVRRLPDGRTERVEWNKLRRVSIVTTDEGPFVEDVFFVLEDSDGNGCVVPQGQAVETKLLERLQQLPGFDNTQIIAAMGSTENNRFVCWEADSNPTTGENKPD